MKKNIIYLAIIALFFATTILSISYAFKEKEQSERIWNNVVSATQEVEHYRAFADSIEVASVRQMELKRSEWEHLFAEQAATIKKLKNAKHPTQVIQSTIRITDTLTIENNRIGEERQFKYEDPHLVLSGVSLPDTTIITYKQRIAITAVEHQRRKRFLGFLWYTGKVEITSIDLFTDNPKAEIEILKSVRIE